MSNLETHLRGVIVGTAVGDAIGLPREGLSRRRATKIFGDRPLTHKLLFGCGMISDDTEHTCMTAQALLASGGQPRAFARSLAWRIRWWFLAFPAGVGMATAKACLKLWLGFPPHRSGIWSAGNGPAMRAAVLGVYAWDDLGLLRELVGASTRLTHTDPAAEHGAIAVALAAAYSAMTSERNCQVDPVCYLELVRQHLTGTEMLGLIESVVQRVQQSAAFESYLRDRGLSRGISGYINHTVPACLYCWLLHTRDYRAAIERIVIAGGDTDSTSAIVGGLVGITAGPNAIPNEWLGRTIEWPRSIAWMRQLAQRLAADRFSAIKSPRPLPLAWPAVPVRNLLFLIVVLIHGLRRLLPPY